MRHRILSVVGAGLLAMAIGCSDPSSARTTITAPESPSFAKGGNPNKVKSITVSPASVTLSMGGAVQLTATANPATSATSFLWSSSNTSVATVNTTGFVTAVGPGETTISASAGGKTGRATVSVSQPVPPEGVVLVGAGDIASCGSSGDEATANLLDGIQGTVFTLGDNAYPNGTISEFNNCYDSSWGRHKSRTRPAPGNHEYNTLNATGYYDYFGSAAGDRTKGYYSYDLGDWHIVVLNSNLECTVILCHAGSVQEQWLRQDLASSSKSCTLAYWHHPRFSSSQHGNRTAVAALWEALYDYGAEIVLNGHDHVYERFAPQTPDAAPDPATGIRQFVVGTGGVGHYSFGTPRPNSEVRNNTAFGVLKLTLSTGGYQWQFIPTAGSFTDSGSGACH